jgi:hypothetical protein
VPWSEVAPLVVRRQLQVACQTQLAAPVSSVYARNQPRWIQHSSREGWSGGRRRRVRPARQAHRKPPRKPCVRAPRARTAACVSPVCGPPRHMRRTQRRQAAISREAPSRRCCIRRCLLTSASFERGPMSTEVCRSSSCAKSKSTCVAVYSSTAVFCWHVARVGIVRWSRSVASGAASVRRQGGRTF